LLDYEVPIYYIYNYLECRIREAEARHPRSQIRQEPVTLGLRTSRSLLIGT
jgi:hypothetical protein